MRDLRDPKNPYKDQYAAYDLWIFAYAWTQAQAQDVRAAQQPQAGHWYSMTIDEQGWPMPQNVAEQKQYDGTAGSCTRSISAYGFMGEQLERTQQRDLLRIQAEHLPAIPAWLADAPPARAMLLPDGEVVALGALGEPPPGIQDTFTYYRLNAQGAQLGQIADAAWWSLYWPDYQRVHDEHPDDVWTESDGYVVRYDSTSGKVVAVYDYTGKRIRGTPPVRDDRYFRWLSGESLGDLYRLQNGLNPLIEGGVDS